MGALLAETRAQLEALVVGGRRPARRRTTRPRPPARWQSLSREARGLPPRLDRRACGRRTISTARLAAVDDGARRARSRARRDARAAQGPAGRRRRSCSGWPSARAARREADTRHAARRRSPDARHRRGPRRGRRACETTRGHRRGGRALRTLQETGRAARARAARDGRVAPLRQRPATGTAHRDGRSHRRLAEERGGDRARTRIWPRRRARFASCTPSGRKSPRRRAIRRSGCGIASAPPPTSSAAAARRTSRSCARNARANLQKKVVDRRGSRGAGRSRPTGARHAARFQELQTEWQQLGPVPRDAGRELAQRFRAACNAFFARRREDLADAQEGVGREPRAEGSALRARRSAGRIDRLGRGRRPK